MELRKTLLLASKILNEHQIAHALIGGFSLSIYGIHRATYDIDFLADGSKKNLIKEQILKNGFILKFESDEVLQFSGPGYLDILLANRPLSLQMLQEAQNAPQLPLKVLQAEDIIGLKIQAYHNDPKRKLQDLADIEALIKNGSAKNKIKVKSYADLFNCWPEIEVLF